MAERDLLRLLRENQDAAVRVLQGGDMAAYRALAKEEAQLMDQLKAVWHGAGR